MAILQLSEAKNSELHCVTVVLCKRSDR
jgi:hypothetical protein